jgi:hypothetical protein
MELEDPLAVPRGVANGLCLSMFIWAMALIGARTTEFTHLLMP